MGFPSAALIVAAAHLPGHSTTGADRSDGPVAKRWVIGRVRARSRVLRGRDDDLDAGIKSLNDQVAGGVP